MPARTRRPKNTEEQHTHLSLRIDSYEAGVEAAVSHNVYAPEYAWGSDEADPVYEFDTRLTITATSLAPPERDGDIYEITIRGGNSHIRRLSRSLKDTQARDEYGSPQYRTFRGKEIPVYDPPKGLGLLDGGRNKGRWTSWLFVQPQFTSDLLVLLAYDRPLFMTIHTHKVGRTHWIQGLTAQTDHPED